MSRCNGCHLKQSRKELGKNFLMLPSGIYEKGKTPCDGQGNPKEHKGQPIRFRWWGMDYGHSYDEDCKIG